MPKMTTMRFRGLWVLAALAAVILCSASGALAQRKRAAHHVTDADVDAMIKQLVDRLFSLQNKQWVIHAHERKPRKGEKTGTIPIKVLTGEMIARKDGHVVFRKGKGKGKRITIPNEYVVKLGCGGSHDVLKYRTRKRRSGEPLAKVPTNTAVGKLVKQVHTTWVFKTEDGKRMVIPMSLVRHINSPGHFPGHAMGSKNNCTPGASALATLALLKAGVQPSNERMKLALQYLRGHELQNWVPGIYGTYSIGMRANVWEHLVEIGGDSGNRVGYRKLLQEDARYLEDGLSDTGWYAYNTGYGPDGTPNRKHGGDHSNTQLGVLGMWAAANARFEIDGKYWNLVNDHWLKTQAPNGSWSYKVDPKGTSSMTTGGLNSLYLVLDLYHSRKQGAYVRFNGIKHNAKAARAVKRVFEAIEKGLGWMKTYDKGTGGGYYLYGLERLGVASGLKRIGGKDWYREGVEYIYNRRKSLGKINAVNGSFLLMFLAYGRAPIIFNKLRTPGDPEWNYYFRDLHYMCRFLTRNFERIHKWQVVSLDENTEEDLSDSPITYLAGTKKPTYTAEQLAKLKNYLENGGTLVLHATRRSSAFAKEAKEVFEELFKDRGYEFAKLPDDHPVYNVHYGRGNGRAISGMDLEGMSDGARTFIFLMPKDIAGAWQQNLQQSNRDLFELMTNLRIYAAPGYFDLPSRLRLLKPIGTPATAKGVLRVARIEHTTHWNANPTVWSVRGSFLAHKTGLTVTLAEKPIALKNADELADVDLLQLVGHADFKLTDDQIKILADWLKGGGMLLMDAAGGQEKFIVAADKLFDELTRATGGQAEMIDAADKLITGEFPGGLPTGIVRYNRWGRAKSPGGGAPNLKTIKIGSRNAVLYSPMDLSAAANGHFIYKMPAYKSGFARKLMDNIALLRWSQKTE